MSEISGVLIFIIGGIVGGIIGFVICRMTLGRKQKAAQQQELDSTKAELDQYKSQVSNHFSDSAKLMGQVASSYQALYTHMAGQSEALLDATDADVPFPQLKTPSETKQDEPLAEKQAAQETAEETIPEAAEEAVQETVKETVPETAEEAAQETVNETVAETAEEAAQETVKKTVPETAEEAAQEIREKKNKDTTANSE